jgi:lia operon protein LiaF
MSKIFFNTVLAFLLVGAGVFLLLINLGILPLDMLEVWEYFYPLVFMALGGKWIIDAFSSRRRRGGDSHGWFWGLAFLTVGTLLLLNKLEIIVFTLRMAWQLWPLLLIYLGISIMVGHTKKTSYRMKDEYSKEYYGPRKEDKRRNGRDPGPGGQTFHEKPPGEWNYRKSNGSAGAHFIRSLHYDEPNWTVDPMDVWQGVGDYHFDFSRAFIPEKETLIKLSGWVGDIDILLPGDVAFKVDAEANVGDIHVLGHKQDGINPYVHYKSPDYDQAERKLAFEFDFKVLDLKIEWV